MPTLLFDKMAAFRKLESKSFTSDQAEAIAEVLHDAMIDSVATKADISALRDDLAGFKKQLNASFLKGQIASILWITTWTTGLVIAAHFIR